MDELSLEATDNNRNNKKYFEKEEGIMNENDPLWIFESMFVGCEGDHW